jgi:hypothetical protein
MGKRPRPTVQIERRGGAATRGGWAAGVREAGVETVLATGGETD